MKKRNPWFRIILIAFLVVVALYYLYPTIRYEQLRKDEKDQFSSLAALSNLSTGDISQNIYAANIDLRNSIPGWDSLDQETQREITEKQDYIKGPFKEKIQSYRGKAIRRGLDLQGGMRLVLEVDLVKLLENLAQRKDETFDRLLGEVKIQTQDPNKDFFQVVTDVFGKADVPLSRYFLNARATNKEIIDFINKESVDAVDRSLEILRNRVDQFGVAEPNILKQGNHRIVIELPGVQDPARARELIGKTALLEFKLLSESEAYSSLIDRIDRLMRQEKGLPPESDTLAESQSGQKKDTLETKAATDTTQHVAQDTLVDLKDLFGGKTETPETSAGVTADTKMLEEAPFKALLRDIGRDVVAVPISNFTAVNNIIHRKEVQELIPKNVEFLWSNDPQLGPGGQRYYYLYLVKSTAELTGAAIDNAKVDIGSGYNPGMAGKPYVSLTLNRQGTRIFSEVTGANIGKQLSIVLDGKIHSAPVIKSKIPSGQAEITGNFTMEEAKDLSIVLRAGALPAPVHVIEERTVGPSLGKDSIQKGELSFVVGFIAVVFFMMLYYRLSGLYADIALFLNLIFLVAFMAGFRATLTLPGVAGIILTIGMAVDSNVLIFERIREELRAGKTIRSAIDTGYARGVTTVMDSQITTLIAGVALYQFGTGPIRGFALTLIVGIISSLFTAIVVVRVIQDIIVDKYELKTLSI
jgi:preprotein translocase subunit SecD